MRTIPGTERVPPPPAQAVPPPPPQAAAFFGERLGSVQRYVELLAGTGVERGVVGPRETARLWERHVLNSAVIGELMAPGCRVLDVGSGAGLPGIALALARPDLTIALLEPMARRVAWLEEVVAELGLPVAVHRGRAELPAGRALGPDWDVVTARAVAPLGRLAGWCLPLVRAGGRLLAVKGDNAAEEVARGRQDVRRAGGGDAEIVTCGVGVVDPPTTVVVVARRRGEAAPSTRRRKNR